MSSKIFWMVYGAGKQPPSFMHDTFADALKESERLSAKHPGTNFYVMEAITSTIARGVVTTVLDPDFGDVSDFNDVIDGLFGNLAGARFSENRAPPF